MPRIRHWMVAVVLAIALLVPSVTAHAVVNTVVEFEQTWERTDRPVAEGQISRTWMWGPEPFTEPELEPYVEGHNGQRVVQYFDKSRMEITDPDANPTSIWYVTNGLLVTEMTSGDMQTGDNTWVARFPAHLNVAGDADDPFGPTYATIGINVQAGFVFQDGQLLTGVIDRQGVNPSLADQMSNVLSAYGVTAGPYSPETGKHTASVFWDFMTSQAMVYENDAYTIAPLFENPYYATGLPIDQAWWAEVKVAGTYQWVLMQCFERRCLTYTPDNPAGWQVEAGNVGQHYHLWRYERDAGPVPLSEEEYLEAIWVIDYAFLESVEYADALWTNPDLGNPAWVAGINRELNVWRASATAMNRLYPPASYAGIHNVFLQAYEYIRVSADYLEEGVATQDTDLIDLGWEQFDLGWDLLSDVFDIIIGDQPPLSEAEYLDLIQAIEDEFVTSATYVTALWEARNFNDQDWVTAFTDEMEYWRTLSWWINQINSPPAYGDLHAMFIGGYAHIANAADYLEEGAVTQNQDLIDLGWNAFDLGWNELEDAFNLVSGS
jgi:hypothetical protein